MNALAAVAHPRVLPVIGDPGVVRRYLAWAPRAAAADRARAISALARAYLHCELADSVRAEAVVALTSALDDPSAQVRRALAEALASAADAPRHIVLALAGDQSDIACVVLARSPMLDDAELVDCAAIGDVVAQTAIARRPRLGAAVAAALAEVAERPAVIALLGNFEAEFAVRVLRRVLDRFGDDAATREALLARHELPAAMRAELAAAAADALARFTAERGWLQPGRAERIGRESREQAVIAIARACSPEELDDLVASLRERGALTVALLMRALMSGDTELLRQSLVDMSGLVPRRVGGFLRDWRGHGFASLYAKAGLPEHFLPAFRAALGVVANAPPELGATISHQLTARTIRACEDLADPELAPIIAMLWRFAGEGAREDARELARDSVIDERAARARPVGPRADVAPLILLDSGNANENLAPAVDRDDETRREIEIADAA